MTGKSDGMARIMRGVMHRLGVQKAHAQHQHGPDAARHHRSHHHIPPRHGGGAGGWKNGSGGTHLHRTFPFDLVACAPYYTLRGGIGKGFGIWLAKVLASPCWPSIFGAWPGRQAVAHFGDYSWMFIADAVLALMAAVLSLPVREVREVA